MTSLLFAMGLIVLVAFASYMKLPLTSVYMVCLAALAFSMSPRPEPLFSLLNLVRIPAMLVDSYGTDLGFTPPATAAMFLGLTFVLDITLTSMLGWRRR